jgi:hypothetical protein
VALSISPISRPIAAKKRLVGNARPCPLVWLDLGLVVAAAVLGRAWDVVIAQSCLPLNRNAMAVGNLALAAVVFAVLSSTTLFPSGAHTVQLSLLGLVRV